MLRGDIKGSFAKGVQQVHAMRKNIDRGLDVVNSARNAAADYLDPSSKPSGGSTPTSSGGSTPTSSGGSTPTSSGGSTGGSTGKVTSPASPDTKPTAAPAAKPATAAPAPGSFKAAYAKARELGGSKAQFEFGGKKYQAAATKAEYVPMSQQKKVDIGSSTTGSSATATSKPPVSVPTPPSRPADVSSAPTPAPKPETSAPSTRVLKTSPSSNSGEVADSVARGGWMDPNSVKNAPAVAWIGDKSVGLKPEKTPGATFSPAPAPTPSGMTGAAGGNPTPSGGGIAPDAGRQSTPTNSGSSISVKPEPSSTTPAPTPKTPDEKKGVAVESKLNEGVQVGNYKYRIV